jgi:hypothetical protein
MWLDNPKVNHKAKGCEIVQWAAEAQDRVQWLAFVNTATDFRIP